VVLIDDLVTNAGEDGALKADTFVASVVHRIDTAILESFIL